MKYFYVLLFLLLPPILLAQLTVVSTSPANNATNVPLTLTTSTVFNLPVDTMSIEYERNVFTNIDSIVSNTISPDKKTISAVVVLKPNKVYFSAIVGGRATTGEKLTSPYVLYFTTGSSFPTLSVSGIVTSSIPGVTPQNAIVGLSSTSLDNESPSFVSWANVNANGTFQIPYVSNGKYWLVAAKDVDGDGNINPEAGSDAVAFGDSILVNGSSITGIVLPLQQMKPKAFAEALSIADSMARKLPSDRVLKSIRTNRVDSAGRADKWDFVYTHSGNTGATEVSVSSVNSKINPITDMGYLSSLILTKPLANPATAAASTLVMTYVEAGGGRAFRMKSVPNNLVLQIEMVLGDLSYTDYVMMSPSPGTQYWGVTYRFGIEGPQMFTTYLEKKFLCNFSTGAVVKSTFVESPLQQVPAVTRLHQNYPNPFNPSTTITYDLARSSFVTVKVYDLLGREVAVLVRTEQDAGTQSVRFDGAQSANGIYYYVLELPDYREVRHMVLMK
ncbi:MAG: T9SS type A sorting domain-containing protein [Ignavibacteriales bacterium]|nr:T9SS type A sorting domain-containing protein [Ignavibacteriales bacterium]